MPLPTGQVTLTSDQQAFYNAAIDRKFRGYRPETPTLRSFITEKVEAPNNPGSTIKVKKHKRLDVAESDLTPLSEDSDVSASKAPNADEVSVTLNEHGKVIVRTRISDLFNVDLAGHAALTAKQLGDHREEVLDALIRAKTDAGTNQVFMNGGTATTSGDKDSVTADDHLTSAALRRIRAKMVADKVPFWGNGTYAFMLHPTQSALLRSETGPDGWREVMNAQGLDEIRAAALGTYEGFSFWEDTLSTVEEDAGTDSDVYRSYAIGREALLEAVALEPHSTVSPQTDHLGRFLGQGWYGVLGHSIYDQTSLVNVFTGATPF